MDFVDSFNLDSAHAKCKRVRSWYLYEQYRSLEKNQLDAAQRLKDKYYQDKILRQELSERRARRRLYDEFGLCQSESRLNKSIRSIPSNTVLGDEELFESFCELHDEYELENYEDNNSHDSQTSKEFDDFKSTETRVGFRTDTNHQSSISLSQSTAGHTNSVVENVKADKLDENIKDELEAVKKNIEENITLQLETVKENIECLEKYAKLEGDEEIPDADVTVISHLKSNVETLKELKKDNENGVIKMWSKFVDFAYKIILLNRGNCYYNYSSQLLTAVLVCDVLLRGVSRMCNILQPYVSPIKYAASESETSLRSNNKTKRKKSVNYEKLCKSSCNKKGHSVDKNKHKKRNLSRKYHSENEWYCCCRNCYENYIDKIKYRFRGTSEPLYNNNYNNFTNGMKDSKQSYDKTQTGSVRGKFSENIAFKCGRHRNGLNPIIQLAYYIDRLIQDIEEIN